MKKKLLTAILALTMAVGLSCVGVGAAYTDTQEHWAKDTIQSWQDRGLIGGYEDGSFRPDNSITRAEVCQLVSTLKGLSGGTGAFPDVDQGDWYYQAVANCASAGYITGYDGGAMGPNRLITRQEAFVIVAKVLGLDASDAGVPPFADAGSVASWAAGSVNALNRAGLLSGYSDNTVRPQRNTTRAEMVTMLNQAAPQPGELTGLLLEDSAHWMKDFTFQTATRNYDLQVWLETYGVRFTPVIAGDAGAAVKVTMSGSGIETQTMIVGKNQTFTLDLTQARESSNPEGTGQRGIEDECRYAAPFQFGEDNVDLPRLVNAIKEHQIPLWLCYAQDDNSVDYTQSHDILIPALDAAQVNYSITVYTPADYLAPMRHFCWAPIWANEEIIDWLLAQSK